MVKLYVVKVAAGMLGVKTMAWEEIPYATLDVPNTSNPLVRGRYVFAQFWPSFFFSALVCAHVYTCAGVHVFVRASK